MYNVNFNNVYNSDFIKSIEYNEWVGLLPINIENNSSSIQDVYLYNYSYSNNDYINTTNTNKYQPNYIINFKCSELNDDKNKIDYQYYMLDLYYKKFKVYEKTNKLENLNNLKYKLDIFDTKNKYVNKFIEDIKPKIKVEKPFIFCLDTVKFINQDSFFECKFKIKHFGELYITIQDKMGSPINEFDIEFADITNIDGKVFYKLMTIKSKIKNKNYEEFVIKVDDFVEEDVNSTIYNYSKI